MKILAGIPTRKRSTSGPIAEILAEVADDVVIISQGATVYADQHMDKIHIVEYPENFGLVPARNEILRFAIKNGYDIVIQSDDDLTYSAEVIDNLVKVVVDNPTLGACASESRAYYHWNKDIECTKPFLLATCTPQLWAARTSILQEVGEWDLPYLEDRAHGCKLWKTGYALGQLHMNLKMTHNPFIARNDTVGKSGGQSEQVGEEKHAGLKHAIDILNERYPEMVTAKYLGLPTRSMQTRYRWDWLLYYAQKRFGRVLGYEDSKGRCL